MGTSFGLGLKDGISIVGDSGVGISGEGEKVNNCFWTYLYSYEGLKIAEAFLNGKLWTGRVLLFSRGLLAFFTEQLSRLSLLCKVWC